MLPYNVLINHEEDAAAKKFKRRKSLGHKIWKTDHDHIIQPSTNRIHENLKVRRLFFYFQIIC